MDGPWEAYAAAQTHAPANGPWNDYAASGGVQDPVQARLANAPAPIATQSMDTITDENKLGAYIDSLPPEQKAQALKQASQFNVATDRVNGGTAQRVGDALTRAGTNVPGIGSYLDEAKGAIDAATGGRYDVGVAKERARQEAVENTPTAKLGTLPIIGDVYESGLEKAAGAIGGGLALPFGEVMSGAGFIPGAVNTAANGLGYGLIQGFGAGEGGLANRAQEALQEGVAGAAAGAALGGPLGKLAQAPGAGNAARNALIQDADTENVFLPQMTASQSPTTRAMAGAMSSAPLTGSIISKAAQRTASDLGAAAERATNQLSNVGAGITASAPDAASAIQDTGRAVQQGLRDWTMSGVSGELKPLYDAVDNATPAGAMVPLTDTAKAVQALKTQSQRSATPVGNEVAGLLDEALSRPQGMDLNGLKELRTYVNTLKNDTIREGGMTQQQGLDKVYGALTSDLKNGYKQVGGQQLLDTFNIANNRSAELNKARELIEGVIGKNNEAVGPSQVVDKLVGMASGTTRGDTEKLLRIRQSLQQQAPGVWEDMTAATIRKAGEARPGAANAGEFSPAVYLTNYNKVSANGKNALYGGVGTPLRDSLDRLANISQAVKQSDRFANPSGTARHVIGFELVKNAATGGIWGTLGTVASSYVISKLLARPASAQAVSRWATAVSNAAGGNVSQAALKLSTMSLARQISSQTGQDEADVNNRLSAAMGGSNGAS